MQQSSFSNDPFASLMTPSPASSPATPKTTHSTDFFDTFQPQVKATQSANTKATIHIQFIINIHEAERRSL
jgi:hypothetical protein